MIATRRFVYVHLHKSGGTFVNECLMRFFPDARLLGYHLPRSLIPAGLRDLPVLGFVRNPFSYYVSWYAFQSAMAKPNALFQFASADRSLDFAGTLGNLLDLGSDDAKLDQLLARLPDAYGGHGLNLPRFALEPIRGSGLGFYGYLYQYMYGGEGSIHIGKVESLRKDLRDFLAGVDCLTPAVASFIDTTPARNTSRHRATASYFSTELADRVRRHDANVIERYGYTLDA